MADTRDAERFAAAVDRLLEGEPEQAEARDLAPLLEVVRQLQRMAPPDEPDPVFRARLRQELVGGGTRRTHPDSISPRASRWQWSWTVRAAAAALLLLAATLWLGPRSKGGDTLDGGIARLPSLFAVASAYAEQMGEEGGGGVPGVLGDATFRLATTLPKGPERARVYRQVREPIDEAGVADLARRLGIAEPTVMEDQDRGVYVAAGEGGRLVVSRAFRGYFFFTALPPSFAPSGSAAPAAPEDAEATRAAREFLQARGLLDFDHVSEVGSDGPPGATPIYRQVAFMPTVEGRPVRGLGVAVTVGQGGRATSVHSARATLAPGEVYPLISPEQAFRRLQDGRPDLFHLRSRSGSGSTAGGLSSAVSSLARSAEAPPQDAQPPSYRVGEVVELEGLLSATIFEARNGARRYDASLLAGPPGARTRVQFRLLGTAVEGLAELDQQHVRLWGRIETLSTQPQGGRLRVERYEKLYSEERLVALLGRLEIQGEGDGAALLLVGDDGKGYLLESPIPALYHQESAGRRALVEGRTTERTSTHGHQVIDMAGMRAGSDVDRMRDLSGYQMERPQVVPEREPLVTGEVAVHRVALEYHATAAAALHTRFAPPDLEPFLLVQPIYSFSGSFDGGRGSFEAHVQGVRPEHVEAQQ